MTQILLTGTVQVKVEGLMVLLVQEMVYACNLGEEDECRKKEILVVSDQLVPEEVGPGKRKYNHEVGCNIYIWNLGAARDTSDVYQNSFPS